MIALELIGIILLFALVIFAKNKTAYIQAKAANWHIKLVLFKKLFCLF